MKTMDARTLSSSDFEQLKANMLCPGAKVKPTKILLNTGKAFRLPFWMNVVRDTLERIHYDTFIRIDVCHGVVIKEPDHELQQSIYRAAKYRVPIGSTLIYDKGSKYGGDYKLDIFFGAKHYDTYISTSRLNASPKEREAELKMRLDYLMYDFHFRP